MVVVSDSPDERFEVGAKLETDHGESLTVRTVRRGAHGRIIGFAEIPDRTAAEMMRGRTLTIGTHQRRALSEGEYWPEDLIGLEVRAETGHVIGKVADVVLGVAQDRLVVDAGDGRVEVPFVDDLVPEVDLDAGVVVVRPIEGLLSEAE